MSATDSPKILSHPIAKTVTAPVTIPLRILTFPITAPISIISWPFFHPFKFAALGAAVWASGQYFAQNEPRTGGSADNPVVK